MKEEMKIDILGGGPAGLAAAYYASKARMTFRVHESASRVGGNCVTFEENGFYFDSGAHRLHNKDEETTDLFKELLGDRIRKIEVPSQIYRDGKFIDFPLSPLNLLKYLGPFKFVTAAVQILSNRLKSQEDPEHFEDIALNNYGPLIADRFLLKYTEKLWGLPAAELSTQVAGKRLKGLDLKTFILETIRGNAAKTDHLDGSFYYPDFGIGVLFHFLKGASDNGDFILNAPVSRLIHDGKKVIEIYDGNGKCFKPELVINSLPLGITLRLLDPAPPPQIIELTKRIKFRNILLIGFFIDKDSINDNGSMYFPAEKYPFTRIYEPRNRSPFMAPQGKTSLIVEIPCQSHDDTWNNPEAAVSSTLTSLLEIGFFEEKQLLGSTFKKLNHAYPILEKNFEDLIAPIYNYLAKFENMHLTGRNGLFAYSHIHDHMVNGRNIIAEIQRRTFQKNEA